MHPLSFSSPRDVEGAMKHSMLELRRLPLREHYDAVIIGGGVQGLALAYNLAKNGYTHLAVIDKAYLSSGASGRNSTFIRDSFATPEWARFFHHSLMLWETISDELGCNVMFTQRGVLSVAERSETIESFHRAAAIHKPMGIQTRVLDKYEMREVAPGLAPHFNGGLFNINAGIARHDALVWGYARAADRLGVEIHSDTEVIGLDVRDGQIMGVRTNRGDIKTLRVIDAAGGLAADVARMAGVELPIEGATLEKFVTDAVKPMLDVALLSIENRCSLSQTSRGEFVCGSSETSGLVGLRATYKFLKESAQKLIHVFPTLAHLSVVRQWGGLLAVTPDHAPLVGEVEEANGLFLSVGWGGYGFMSAPAAGELLASWFLRGERSELISPFDVMRYKTGKLIPETLIPVHGNPDHH